MKYAKLGIGEGRSGLFAETIGDTTAISVVIDNTEAGVLVTDSVAALQRYVETAETVRRCIEAVRESPVVQKSSGTTAQRVTGSLIHTFNKQSVVVNIDVVQSTTLITAVPDGSVGIIIPPTGGLTNQVRSALIICLEGLLSFNLDPPVSLP